MYRKIGSQFLLLVCAFTITTCVTGQELPLHKASKNDNINAINNLLQQGYDTNKKNQDGKSPLYIAVENGHKAIAQLLIDQGANINTQNKDGKTPLYIAAEKGHESIVNLLICQGTDITITTHIYGDLTATDIAGYANHDQIAQIIEQTQRANRSATQRIQNGESPASIIDDNAQITVVFEKASLKQKDQLIKTYPHILYNYLYYTNNLENGISTYTVPDVWLFYAAQYGHTDIMEQLLSKGIKFNEITDKNGNLAIHIAALYNRPHILKQLLNTGFYCPHCLTGDNPKPGPDYRNDNGLTPYEIAKEKDHKAIGKILSNHALTKTIIGEKPKYIDDQEEQEEPPKKVRRTEKALIKRLPPELSDIIARKVATD
jgi:serine/threonine-protein phosphatase 6 regulatory ankyrin repeat subunit B